MYSTITLGLPPEPHLHPLQEAAEAAGPRLRRAVASGHGAAVAVVAALPREDEAGDQTEQNQHLTWAVFSHVTFTTASRLS